MLRSTIHFVASTLPCNESLMSRSGLGMLWWCLLWEVSGPTNRNDSSWIYVSRGQKALKPQSLPPKRQTLFSTDSVSRPKMGCEVDSPGDWLRAAISHWRSKYRPIPSSKCHRIVRCAVGRLSALPFDQFSELARLGECRPIDWVCVWIELFGTFQSGYLVGFNGCPWICRCQWRAIR